MKKAQARVPRGQRERSQRQLRVGEALRHALAGVLERGEVRDPDLVGVSVTVTEVRVSPDLRFATAYVLPLGGVSSDTVVAALRRAAPFLRRRIGREITLKYLPSLRFEADTSFDRAARIDTLLRSPDVAEDAAGSDGDGT